MPLIRQEYEPKAVTVFVSWDETVEQLKTALAQDNNKPKTVKDYLSSIKVLREVYPDSRGPQDITPALAKSFKARYQTTVKSPYTVANRLNKLSVIWNK